MITLNGTQREKNNTCDLVLLELKFNFFFNIINVRINDLFANSPRQLIVKVVNGNESEM